MTYTLLIVESPAKCGKIEKFLPGVGLHIQTVHHQYFINENI